jgi:DNA-directed RNA polymerase specialized sigma24 family protein
MDPLLKELLDDPDTLGRLAHRLREKFGRTIPVHECDDLAGDALVRARERAWAFDPTRGNPWTWLRAIAWNRARDWLRREKRRGKHRAVEAGPEPLAPDEGVFDPVVALRGLREHESRLGRVDWTLFAEILASHPVRFRPARALLKRLVAAVLGDSVVYAQPGRDHPAFRGAPHPADCWCLCDAFADLGAEGAADESDGRGDGPPATAALLPGSWASQSVVAGWLDARLGNPLGLPVQVLDTGKATLGRIDGRAYATTLKRPVVRGEVLPLPAGAGRSGYEDVLVITCVPPNGGCPDGPPARVVNVAGPAAQVTMGLAAVVRSPRVVDWLCGEIATLRRAQGLGASPWGVPCFWQATVPVRVAPPAVGRGPRPVVDDRTDGCAFYPLPREETLDRARRLAV